MIRNAKTTDIPAILRLLHANFELSHYAKAGIAGIDVPYTKKLLAMAIMRHGHSNGGGCFVQVAETNGTLSGLIFGTLARPYSIGTHLMASDLFWLCSPNIDPKEPKQLMQNMIDWAKSCPNVIEIKCGASAIIKDRQGAGKILERLGFEPYGDLYRMETRA